MKKIYIHTYIYTYIYTLYTHLSISLPVGLPVYLLACLCFSLILISSYVFYLHLYVCIHTYRERSARVVFRPAFFVKIRVSPQRERILRLKTRPGKNAMFRASFVKTTAGVALCEIRRTTILGLLFLGG